MRWLSVVLSVPFGGGITGAGATTGGATDVELVVVWDEVVCANAAPVININAAALAKRHLFMIENSSELWNNEKRRLRRGKCYFTTIVVNRARIAGCGVV